MAHRYEHTYYNQGDPRWGSLLYSPHMTYAAGGCGPTSVAVAVSGVAGNGVITPVDVGSYISSIGGVTDGQGTNWNAIPQACAHFGVRCTQLSLSSEYGIKNVTAARKEFLEKIPDERYSGIELHGLGPYTNGGHYTFCRDGKADHSLETYDVAYDLRNGWKGYADQATIHDKGFVNPGYPFHYWTTKIFYLIDFGQKVTSGSVKFKLKQISKINGSFFLSETVILQRLLRSHGHKVDVDGYFGPQTGIHLENFQKENGLTVDGVCGPKTWAKLFGVEGTASGSYYILELNTKHFSAKADEPDDCVTILQRFLKAIEKKNKEGKMVPLYSGKIDGWYGNDTTKGVWAYQNIRKLNTDGICGPITLNDLFGGLKA